MADHQQKASNDAWKKFQDQVRHNTDTIERQNEETKKKGITLQDGIISIMIDQLKAAEAAIKTNQRKASDDRTKSMNAENEFREKMNRLTARVEKLEKPISSHRPYSYQGPYFVSDLTS